MKKRGDDKMKKVLFVVALLFVFIPIKAYAYGNRYASFYEGEYIPDAYIKKFKDNKGKYEQMRVLRREGDNSIVYCLELWESMYPYTMGGQSIMPRLTGNIDSWRYQLVVLIAYYGYGYQNHNSLNWYAATQFMIWQTLSPNSIIYFTDKLNGNKVVKFQKEMDEINDLINKHSIVPNFKESKDILYNKDYDLIDTNNVLSDYEIEGGNNIRASKNNNILTISSTNKANTEFKLVKKDKLYNDDPIIYESTDGQDLLLPGSYGEKTATYYFNVKTTDVTISKKDYDTKSNTPSGDASLENTEFELLDEKYNHIDYGFTDEFGHLTFKNIGYGDYYLKEIGAGSGYKLNDNLIKIHVGDNKVFDVYNEVIKNTVIINKFLKNIDGTLDKEDAMFELYNDNQRILSFNTKDGFYSFDLPYGDYVLKQVSGKDNYKYVDDINIKVEEDGITQKFDLYDEEIKLKEIGDISETTFVEYEEILEDVPNTYKKASINIIKILMINLGLLYFKGKEYV